MDWTALVQEPCDGPKIATTPSASWSQAATEEGKDSTGVSAGSYQVAGGMGDNNFGDPINTWEK